MKAILRIGIILLIIGLLGATITALAAKDDLEANLMSQTYIYDKTELTDISISVSNNPVVVLPSEDDKIKIVVIYESYETLSEVKTGSKLSVSVSASWKDYFLNGFRMFDITDFLLNRTVYIYLPDMLYELDVKTSNGSIVLKDVALNNVALKTSNGSINVLRSTFNTLGTQTSNGSIELNEVISQKADLETSNGILKVNDVNIGELLGSTSNGEIKAYKVTSNNVKLTTSNGGIRVDVIGTFVDYKVTTKTSNGKVKINGVTYGSDTYNKNKTPSVIARTSNGNVNINFSND